MATTITNNGASIKIDSGSSIRNIMKNQVIEVSVIKTNVIKIDIGQGALYNVFIQFADVTNPTTANPGALRDAINDMMANSVNSTSGGSGDASAAKQDTQISNQNTGLNKLDTISSKLDAVNTAVSDASANIQNLYDLVSNIDSKLFIEPIKVDESNPNSVYKGYAIPGTLENNPSWAILRISNASDIKSYEWADGNKNFDNVWHNRATLTYV